MRNCIKTELYKAFHNRAFITLLIIGAIIALGDFLFWYYWPSEDIADGFLNSLKNYRRSAGAKSLSGYSLPRSFILCNDLTPVAKVFCATWPLLACIPFSASYHRELRSGYSAQITSRTGKLRYLFSKQAALFIVGGVTASFPALLNLIIESMFIPCIGSLLAQDTSPFASLHLNAPFLYCLLLCGVLFIWGGAAASISLSVSRLLNSRVLIIIFPFLLMFFTIFVLEAFFPSSHFLLHPIHQPIPGAGGLHSSVLVFGEAFLLLALSSAVYYPLGIKHEGL